MASVYSWEGGYATEAAYRRIMEADNFSAGERRERYERGDTSLQTFPYDVTAYDVNGDSLYYETIRAVDRYDLEDGMIALAHQKGLSNKVHTFYCERIGGGEKFTYRYR